MPVHGHPRDMEAIQQIADNYNIKIIFMTLPMLLVRKMRKAAYSGMAICQY